MSEAPPDSRPVASILIVDDHPANLLVLETVLGPLRQRIVRAASGEEALARLREGDFAVVLLDVMMPGIDGLTTADLFQAQEHGGAPPIIFMTAGDTPALEGYAHGAVDFLRKPLDRDVVRAKVSVFVELFRAREKVKQQAARLAQEERRAAARTAALLNASLDAVIGMDHLGRVTEFNGAAEVMFGRQRAAVLGGSLADLFVPLYLRDAHRRGLAQYLATGESRMLDKRIEVTALRADGTEFPIELAIRRVVTDGPPTFLGYARDLTARRAAETERAALMERERLARADAEVERLRLHTLLMQVPAFICIQRGPEHVYEFANLRYRAFVGHRELDGRTVREAFPELEGQGVYELLDRVLATGEAITVPELRVHLNRGQAGILEDGYFNVIYQPLLRGEGPAEGVMTFAYDVTEQVRARQRVEVAEAKFRRIFESNMIGFLFTTADGRVLDANEYFLRMLGFARDDLQSGGIRLDRITPPEYQAVGAQALEQLRTADVTAPFEKEYFRKDGSRVSAVLGSARLPAGAGGADFVTFALDTSHRKALEAEREQLLAAAQAGEDQFRTLLAAAGEGIYGVDTEGRITFINPAAAQLLGRSAEELHGKLQHDLIHHTRRDGSPYPREHSPIYAAVHDGAVHHRDDEVFWRKDETSFPVEYTTTPIRDGGTLAGAVVVFRDITERQRSQARRNFLSDASQALASSLDYEAIIQTVVHLAVPRVADWCAVEVMGDDPRSTVRIAVSHVDPTRVEIAEELRRRYPPDPGALQGVPNVLRTGRSELYEDVTDTVLERAAQDAEHLRILRGAGLRSAMIVPITSRNRRLGAMTFVAAESGRRYGPSDLATAEDLARRVAIAMDNALLYRATQAAEARNRFLSEATEALASSLDYDKILECVARAAVPRIADLAAVYALEPDGAIRLKALAACDPALEVLGRELDVLLPLRVEQQHRPLPRVVCTGRAEMLAELPHALREAWSPTSRAEEIMQQLAIRSYMVVPLIVRGIVLGALALTTSVSERHFCSEDLALTEELARRAGLAVENAQLYREAQNASRLKDEFLATISHELRTPLTSILGWIHLLRSGRVVQVARAIDTIERNARVQARIVDDVLDVSRIITGKLRLQLESINLADAVQAAVETVRPAAEAKDIDLIITLDPAAGKIAGDAARLQQVAWNLISNAIKFTPKGGRVEVRLQRDESNVYLRVNDTGQGIRRDFLPYVFERFRQAEGGPTRVHGGLGLGLAIVRHLVELHGGYVTVASEGEGRGAMFTVMLPIHPVSRAEEEAAPEPLRETRAEPVSMPLALDGVHVLVVDEEADERDLIAALLEQQGAQVTMAPSARVAHEVLVHALPDVLVSGVGMEGEDGHALIRQVRELGVERGFWFPALALTAYAHMRDRNRALSAGYQAHLSKPIEPTAFLAVIAQLAGRSPGG